MNATTSLLDEIRGIEPIDGYNLRSYFNLAEAQAEKLLELLGIDEAPVTIETLKRVPDVAVERRVKNLPAMHDRITLRDGTFRIVIDGTQDVESQRFQLAHALQHVLTYAEKSNVDWQCWDQTGRDIDEFDEALADRFAIALLMPETWVRNAYTDGTTELNALAEMFGVSLNRMAYRLAVLGLPLNEDYERTAAGIMHDPSR